MTLKHPGLSLFIASFGTTVMVLSQLVIYGYTTLVSAGWLIALISFLSSILMIVLYVPLYKFTLNVFDHNEIKTKELLSLRRLLNVAVFSLIFDVLLVIGTMLLIIPGIIVFTKLFQGFFLVVEQDMGPFEATARSWVITKGYGFKIFLFFLTMGIFWIALFLIFGVESLVSVILVIAFSPLILYSVIFIYRYILYKSQPEEQTISSFREKALSAGDFLSNKLYMLVMIAVLILGLFVYANIEIPQQVEVIEITHNYQGLCAADFDA